MEQRVLELLKESEALLEGHFLLSSGKHSDKYVQCANFDVSRKVEEVCKVLRKNWRCKCKSWCSSRTCDGRNSDCLWTRCRALGVRAMFMKEKMTWWHLEEDFFINEGEKCTCGWRCCYNRKIIIGNYKGFKRTWCNVVEIASIVDRTNETISNIRFSCDFSKCSSIWQRSLSVLQKDGKIELVNPQQKEICKYFIKGIFKDTFCFCNQLLAVCC